MASLGASQRYDVPKGWWHHWGHFQEFDAIIGDISKGWWHHWWHLQGFDGITGDISKIRCPQGLVASLGPCPRFDGITGDISKGWWHHWWHLQGLVASLGTSLRYDVPKGCPQGFVPSLGSSTWVGGITGAISKALVPPSLPPPTLDATPPPFQKTKPSSPPIFLSPPPHIFRCPLQPVPLPGGF